MVGNDVLAAGFGSPVGHRGCGGHRCGVDDRRRSVWGIRAGRSRGGQRLRDLSSLVRDEVDPLDDPQLREGVERPEDRRPAKPS